MTVKCAGLWSFGFLCHHSAFLFLLNALYAFCYGYAFAMHHAVNFLNKWVKTSVSALTAREETNGISYNVHSKRRTQGHVDGRPTYGYAIICQSSRQQEKMEGLTYGYAQSSVCLVCDLKYDLIKRRCLQLLINKNDEGLEGSSPFSWGPAPGGKGACIIPGLANVETLATSDKKEQTALRKSIKARIVRHLL
ncbi:hypothetical protein Tco_1518410, partial [Tanacetum coccineum]